MVKVKSPQNAPWRPTRGEFFSFNLGARRGRVLNATSQSLYPRERDLVLIVQEAGWAPAQVWTGVENLTPNRDSIPGPSSPLRVAIPTELFRLNDIYYDVC